MPAKSTDELTHLAVDASRADYQIHDGHAHGLQAARSDSRRVPQGRP